MLKKYPVLFFTFLFLLIGMNFVNASLCKNHHGYYSDCYTVKELVEKHYEYGYKEGFKTGYKYGYERGYDYGYKKGYENCLNCQGDYSYWRYKNSKVHHKAVYSGYASVYSSYYYEPRYSHSGYYNWRW